MAAREYTQYIIRAAADPLRQLPSQGASSKLDDTSFLALLDSVDEGQLRSPGSPLRFHRSMGTSQNRALNESGPLGAVIRSIIDRDEEDEAGGATHKCPPISLTTSTVCADPNDLQCHNSKDADSSTQETVLDSLA